MDTKVGVVANLRAGGGYQAFQEVLGEIQSYNGRVFYHLPDSVTKLAPVLIDLVEVNKVDLIFVYGGDGTLHKVVDVLIYELERGNISRIPPLLPLGGGTQKSLFRWLGWGKGLILHEKPIDIFRKAMATPFERLPQRRTSPLAISFVNREKGRKETHYGFIFIMGAMNRVIELYDRTDKSVASGLKHIGLATLASVTGFPRSHAELVHQFKAQQRADEKEIPHDDPFVVLCSVTDSLLFGIEPFAGKAESNQFYAASYAVPAPVLGAMVPVEWRGWVIPRHSRFFNQPVFSFELTPETEGTFFVDGDFFANEPGEPLKISLGPEIALVSHF